MNQQQDYAAMWEQFGRDKAGILSDAKFQPTYRIGLTNHLRERAIFQILPLEATDTVADIGCASGRQAFIAAQTARFVYGTDIADSFIQFARRLQQKNNIQNVTFLTAPTESLPFQNGQMHKIICSEVIEHVLDLDASLKELHRVLQQNGKLLITVPNYNADGTLWGRLLRWLGWRSFKPLTDFSPAGMVQHGDSHVREFNIQSLKATLERHGFEPIRWTTVSMVDFHDRAIGLALKLPLIKTLIIQLEYLLSYLGLPFGRHIIMLCEKQTAHNTEAIQTMPELKHILCVGDSLTFGARDEYHQSYPAELSRLYWERQRLPVYCTNHGISGETTSQLRHRIYQNERSCPEAKLALLLIGTNDTFLPQRPEIYKDNLRQIITVLKHGGRRVGIGFLPPIIGPGLPNYPNDAQQQADRFNEIIQATAKEFDCFTADFRGLGRYIIDTVHFNHAGYVAMAEIWYDAIQANRIIL